MTFLLPLSGAQAWFQEVGTGAVLTRGGHEMVSFECQPAQSTGAPIRLYFWVCWGLFLDEVKIRISTHSSVDQHHEVCRGLNRTTDAVGGIHLSSSIHLLELGAVSRPCTGAYTTGPPGSQLHTWTGSHHTRAFWVCFPHTVDVGLPRLYHHVTGFLIINLLLGIICFSGEAQLVISGYDA